MSRSQAYIWHIAMTLKCYGVVPHLTEETIQRAYDLLRQETRPTTVWGALIVLDVFVEPGRRVEDFDPEIDNCEEAVQVIHHYARATMGEWVPAYVSSMMISNAEDEQVDSVAFDFRGTPFRWQFTIGSNGKATDWASDFYERLFEFFTTHLEGTFFYTGSHYEMFEPFSEYYLPRKAAAELTSTVEHMEEHFGFDGFNAFVQGL